MKKCLFIIFSILFICDSYSYDTFFCIDGPLRIRSEPNILSQQIGSIDLFDKAIIIEKTNTQMTIGEIKDFWYRIKFGNVAGYVFGGYGIVIKEKYEVSTIDDFIKILPEKFIAEEAARKIYVYEYSKTGIPMIKLFYNITFMNHQFYLDIYCRPKYKINVDDVSKELNLEIMDANDQFGTGSSYNILNSTQSDEFITNFGDRGKYFFSFWGSGISYDRANFLFETNFDKYFNGIIVSPFNIWTNNNDYNNIVKINNRFIDEARTYKIKESVLYQIFYELILRIKIIN